MASFLENPQQFSPYIPQLPVEAMVSVGVQKQQEYNMGVQKVESYIQSLSGIDVVRDVDRKYLNSRIESFTTDINKIAGSKDWSNQIIQNQIGSMASQLYNDPKIQSAVAGSLQYKRLLGDIAESKKSQKGYSVQNEWDALSSVQNWLNDPQAGAAYTGKQYSPYVDVNSKVKDYLKQIQPDWIIESDPMSAVTGSDGSVVAYVMRNGKKEFIDPIKVKNTLQGVLQPEDWNQLDINGRYSGRYYNDPVLLKNEINRRNTRAIGSLTSQRDAYKAQVQKNQDNPSYLNQLNSIISKLDKEIESTNRTYQNYRDSIDSGNLEGVKSSVYVSDWMDGWAETYGYTKNEVSYEESPVYKAILAKQKEDREHAKHLLDLEKTRAEIQKIRTGKSESDKSQDETSYLPNRPGGISPESANRIAVDFATTTETMKAQLNNSIWSAMYDYYADLYGPESEKLNQIFNVTTNQEGQVVFRPKKGQEGKVAMDYGMLKESWQKNPSSVIPSMSSVLQAVDSEEKVLDARTKVFNKVAKEADTIFGIQDILRDRPVLNVNIGQSRHTFTPQDFVNINERIFENPRFSGTLGAFAPENVSTFTSPKEQFAIRTVQKFFEGTTPLNAAEQAFIDNLNDTRELITPQISRRQAERSEFINTQLRPIAEVVQPNMITLPGGKAEEIRNSVQTVNDIVGDIVRFSNNRPPTDVQDANLDEYTSKERTNYNISLNPDGSAQLSLYNPEVSERVKNIQIDKEIFSTYRNRLFPTLPGPVKAVQDLLGLNRTPTGNAYTGVSKEDALFLNNPYLTNYSISYNVDRSRTGAHNIKLYIYDKNANQQIRDSATPLIIPNLPSIDKVFEFLNAPDIEQLIKPHLQEKTTINPPISQ